MNYFKDAPSGVQTLIGLKVQPDSKSKKLSFFGETKDNLVMIKVMREKFIRNI